MMMIVMWSGDKYDAYHTCRVTRSDDVVQASIEVVSTSHQRCPGWSAERVHVMGLQLNALLRQSINIRCGYRTVLIVIAEITIEKGCRRVITQ